MAKRITVVVSQGQSANPAKRDLEEEIVAGLLMEKGIDVTVVPHLYDLSPDGTGILALQGVQGNMVVLSWLYERAAHWTLDRNGIQGQLGETLLRRDAGDEDEELDDDFDGQEQKARVIDQREIPQRKIYCIDLRAESRPQAFIEEVKRIAAENNQQVVSLTNWIGGTPKAEQMQRYLQPAQGNGSHGAPSSEASPEPRRVDEKAGRRWYPVIDFSRCTNCMECIDFCLFGVYGVDAAETILVEQPDNCRKGCPACSRVCPENAIIFPQHKTPAIAGSPDVAGGLKIDLSQLFGAPSDGQTAVDVAVAERDEQLMLAGRAAVGSSVGIPKRQPAAGDEPKDELDHLIDELDELDL